jgi:hypothetical protein
MEVHNTAQILAVNAIRRHIVQCRSHALTIFNKAQTYTTCDTYCRGLHFVLRMRCSKYRQIVSIILTSVRRGKQV